MTTTPTPEAVEALAMAIYCHSPDDEMPVGLIREMAAKACIERLYSLGYTITRADPAAPSPDAEKDIGTIECIGRCLGGAFERDLLTHSKLIRTHISALEAENKRLREPSK